MNRKTRIVITTGDPCGIGPYVTAKAVGRLRSMRDAEFVVVGHAGLLARSGLSDSVGVHVLDAGVRHFEPGQPNLASARASLEYLRLAVSLIKDRQVDGLVTGPICKENVRKAGFSWPGHTEFLADAFGIKQVEMLFVSDRLKVVPVTRHVSLAQAIRQLDKKKITACGSLMARLLNHCFRLRQPRIAVCGLNPHAGEGGLFGSEEIKVIAPAVKQLNKLTKAHFFGPLPADTVFQRAFRGEFDLVMAMTHDQGLIAFKMIDFENGVNLTAGLPFIRTSPVHGTAFDIARKRMRGACEDSMLAAILLATRLTKNSQRCLRT
ncbi:MAG: 4-hydroxythreonine-4-phosphate dehydrogenase PdxA [Candidatus Omnitrophota bacterium]